MKGFDIFQDRQKMLEDIRKEIAHRPCEIIPKLHLKHLDAVYMAVAHLLEDDNDDSFSKRLMKLEKVYWAAEDRFSLEKEAAPEEEVKDGPR